nr:ATP-binding protein [Chitinispirillaceae bacterium]
NQPVDIRTLLQEIHTIFEIKAQEKRLEFTVECDDGIPEQLLLDEVRIRQILLNLTGNALKFTSHGFVRLRILENGIRSGNQMNLTITVEDTGIGIPAADQEIIFESFRQQTGQDSKKYGGTGLGLAITRKLVNIMKGSISVTSEPGKGSVFTVVLKNVGIVALSRELPEKTADSGNDNFVFDKATVLVVDDIESNRRLLAEIFRDKGLDVREATNGLEAITAARLEKPALIVMDIHMPVMNGREAAIRLKNEAATSAIPIIALTASVTEQPAGGDTKALYAAYIIKPINIEKLFCEMKALLPHTPDKQETSGTAAARPEYSITEFDNISETLSLLEQEIIPRFTELVKFIKMDEIEKFSSDLRESAAALKAAPLVDIATKLDLCIDSFDVINIKKTLDSFMELAQFLKRGET